MRVFYRNERSVNGINLYQKLAEIRKMCEVISKNKSGFNYRYVSIDEILAKVSAGMKKYGVSLVPEIPSPGEVTVREFVKKKKDRAGNTYDETNVEYIAQGVVTYTWVNDENPEERITIPWFLSGAQSDPSQAYGSALSYGMRYFLLQYFQIATPEDDPDAWRSKQQKAEMEQAITMIKSIIDTHLIAHPDDREKVAAIVGRYARQNGKPSANYNLIKSPDVAQSLIDDLTNELTTEGK